LTVGELKRDFATVILGVEVEGVNNDAALTVELCPWSSAISSPRILWGNRFGAAEPRF